MASGEVTAAQLVRGVRVGTYVYGYVGDEFEGILQKVSPRQYKIIVIIYHGGSEWGHTARFDISDIRTDFHARALADEEAQRLLMCAQLTGGFGDVGRG